MGSDLLEELYERYANDGFRYACYWMGNCDGTLDVLNEVFIQTQRSIQDFQHKSNPKTWLMSSLTTPLHPISGFYRNFLK